MPERTMKAQDTEKSDKGRGLSLPFSSALQPTEQICQFELNGERHCDHKPWLDPETGEIVCVDCGLVFDGQSEYDRAVEHNKIVYFVQSRLGGPIKIGLTTQLNQRLKQLQNESPIPLQIVGALRGDEKVEAAIHERFRKLRLHGEWFEPSTELVEFIRQIGVGDK